MRWNYDNPEVPGNLKAIRWYKSHNLPSMAATAGQTMWAMMPRSNSNFQPVKDFSRITSEEKMNGILLTLWDDTSPHFETYWRGIYDFALLTWNYSDIKKEEAHTAFRHRFYGPQVSAPSFNFQDTLESAIKFWETALINTGDRENYPRKIDTLTLPDAASPGAWSESNAEKITNAHRQVEQYKKTKKTIAMAMSLAKRNKYSLQVLDQINELQVYPSELLVRLEKYDRAQAGAQKKSAAAAVKNYARTFSAIRKNYENVFTRTRVLHNPKDYLMDQNHHAHLANGTKNSDWMYVYELAMNEKINKSFIE
jgi:hypothetical protein